LDEAKIKKIKVKSSPHDSPKPNIVVAKKFQTIKDKLTSTRSMKKHNHKESKHNHRESCPGNSSTSDKLKSTISKRNTIKHQTSESSSEVHEFDESKITEVKNEATTVSKYTRSRQALLDASKTVSGAYINSNFSKNKDKRGERKSIDIGSYGSKNEIKSGRHLGSSSSSKGRKKIPLVYEKMDTLETECDKNVDINKTKK